MTLTRQLLVMAVLAVLLGLGARTVQKSTVPFWGFPKPMELIQPQNAVAAENVSATDAFPPAQQAYAVNLSTTMGLFMKRKKDNVHFVDARDPKLYDAGHIPGAANIPFEKVDQYQSQVNALPKSDLILLYCDGGDCHLSHDLAEYLLQRGWNRLAVFEGGWAEWSEQTDQIETGPKATE